MIVINLEGGCGNQLFMMAFGLAYAKKHNLDYCVHTKVSNPHIYDKGVYNLSAYRFPGINYCDNPPELTVFAEPHFHYAELPKMDNVCFRGFWQSWRYMHGYREEILRAFDIPYEFKNDTISCHIRLGDYLLYPDHHPIITLEYIYKAMNHFKSLGYYKFIILSDGIDWCFDNVKPLAGCGLQFSEGRTELEDLALGSSCAGNIGSNSSYSWWIYYLNQNPNKIGIFPKENWFGKLLPHNIKDLLPPECILL